MLEPAELRIGNYVKLNTGAGKLVKVDWQVLKDISEQYAASAATTEMPMYVPVEINGEILFELGFEWDNENAFIFQKGKTLLKRRRNGFFIMLNNSKPYHKKPAVYLHQLQNLYKVLFDEDLSFPASQYNKNAKNLSQ